jgi:hypothetical protein
MTKIKYAIWFVRGYSAALYTVIAMAFRTNKDKDIPF